MIGLLFLSWAIVFWAVALLSFFLGFSGAASTSFFVANALGVVAVLLGGLFFALHYVTKSRVAASDTNASRSRLAEWSSRIAAWRKSA